MAYDLLIKNGMVVDGTGAPARQADVAAQAPRADQRREPFAQADPVVGVVDGQHVVVAPQGRLAQGEVARAHVLGRALQVVAREERPAALAQVQELSGRVTALAARALEVGERHARPRGSPLPSSSGCR